MSFPAQAFRILIASPSDVSEERELAVRAIQEWNDLNAAERQIVLLPLRWETHSAPEYGKRPQEVINKQIVDRCDLLIGIFWTRVGSHTGIAESGTIEEIERVASAGKLVMLYFSQGKQDPERIDIEQLSRLREFKKKTFPNALIEQYASPIEFKDKLAKQIEIQLRSILATTADNASVQNDNQPLTDISLNFADADSGVNLGDTAVINSTFIDIEDYSLVPDYMPSPVAEEIEKDPKSGKHQNKLLINAFRTADTNKDYYRQRTAHIALRSYFRPIRFWLKNKGRIGARDIYIDLKLVSNGSPITLIERSKLPSTPPARTKSAFSFDSPPNSLDELAEDSSEWSSHIEVRALQPQRELSPESQLVIGARRSCEVTVTATIFADTLAEPITQHLSLSIDVEHITFKGDDMIQLLTPEPSAED
ncbi:DUF4062 domain-containing protein [Lysobacter capsici]|uniref:DUF4062 domain-containing protein n=1 Tax=Lysobacter capsici TaxID=435897 RepID=UPI001C004277|nr:DUF4062 domain-containing protein [Lysobacter capsici]QWF15115.1 DUF4062 domain-containing protein [Lysobacter capsici]